jgi:hypothetical protein
MSYKTQNLAKSTLQSSLGGMTSDVILQIQTADISNFPVINDNNSAPDEFTLGVLSDSAGNKEFVKVTRHDTGASTMTIVRQFEESTRFPARAWSAGDSFMLALTAGVVTQTYTHPGESVGAHAATAISVTPAGGIAATTVQAALEELDSEKASAGHSHPASAISFTPAGGLGSTNTQAAIEELDTEKAPKASPTFTGTVTAEAITVKDNGFLIEDNTTSSKKFAVQVSGVPDDTTVTMTVPPSNFTPSAVGKQTIWIPAAAFTPRTTNGASLGTVETTTNKVMLKTLDFDQTTEEYAQFMVAMPKSWDEGTLTAIFKWSSTGAGDVVWGLRAVAISNDDPLDAAFGTGQTVTDTNGTASDLMDTAETSAIMIGGTPAENDMVVLEVYRKAADGADTIAADARLHGVKVFYTTSGINDA